MAKLKYRRRKAYHRGSMKALGAMSAAVQRNKYQLGGVSSKRKALENVEGGNEAASRRHPGNGGGVSRGESGVA